MGEPTWSPTRYADGWTALVRAIAGQQLSVVSAEALFARLVALGGGAHVPDAAAILALDPEELRVAGGLSHAKTRYLRALAEHVVSGSLVLEELDALSDAEVEAALTAVPGIGPWSAHLFLMFQLGRPDVLAPGDLGVRKAVQRAWGLSALPTPREVELLAEPWRPYRTAACVLLWASLGAAPA